MAEDYGACRNNEWLAEIDAELEPILEAIDRFMDGDLSSWQTVVGLGKLRKRVEAAIAAIGR